MSKGWVLLLASSVFCSLLMAASTKAKNKARQPAADTGPKIEVTGPGTPLPVRGAEERVQLLEDRVEKMEAEIDELRQHQEDSNIRIIDFSGMLYLRGGLELILPQASSFTYATDNGLGLVFGGGGYLTHDHAVDISFQWDAHLAAALRYRYELHSPKNFFAWGPTAGIRTKLSSLRPFDNFLHANETVQSTFFILGAFSSLTIPGGQLFFELTYNFNSQKFITGTVSLNLFL